MPSPQPWSPSVDDVAALLRARTRDRNGNEAGTFNANTRPTDVQVAELIDMAVGDVASAVGQNIPSDMFGEARAAAAERTAVLVEISFFPEQVGRATSPVNVITKMYDDRLGRLTRAAEAEGAEVPGEEYMHPAGAFGGNPLPIRWWTAW